GGSARQRTIIARIARDGVPGVERVVGHYRTTLLRPGRPGRIRVQRAGKRWRISFKPARNTTSHDVTVRMRDGRQWLLALTGRKHRLTVPAQPVAVEVVGLRGTKHGPARIVRASARR